MSLDFSTEKILLDYLETLHSTLVTVDRKKLPQKENAIYKMEVTVNTDSFKVENGGFQFATEKSAQGISKMPEPVWIIADTIAMIKRKLTRKVEHLDKTIKKQLNVVQTLEQLVKKTNDPIMLEEKKVELEQEYVKLIKLYKNNTDSIEASVLACETAGQRTLECRKELVRMEHTYKQLLENISTTSADLESKIAETRIVLNNTMIDLQEKRAECERLSKAMEKMAILQTSSELEQCLQQTTKIFEEIENTRTQIRTEEEKFIENGKKKEALEIKIYELMTVSEENMRREMEDYLEDEDEYILYDIPEDL